MRTTCKVGLDDTTVSSGFVSVVILLHSFSLRSYPLSSPWRARPRWAAAGWRPGSTPSLRGAAPAPARGNSPGWWRSQPASRQTRTPPS